MGSRINHCHMWSVLLTRKWKVLESLWDILWFNDAFLLMLWLMDVIISDLKTTGFRICSLGDRYHSRRFPDSRNLTTINRHLEEMVEDTAKLVSSVAQSAHTNMIWTRSLTDVNMSYKICNTLPSNHDTTFRIKRLKDEIFSEKSCLSIRE